MPDARGKTLIPTRGGRRPGTSMPHDSIRFWLVIAAAILLLFAREWPVKGAGLLVLTALFLPDDLRTNVWFYPAFISALIIPIFVLWGGFRVIRRRFGGSEGGQEDDA
jgi:hypothetical protein